MLQDDCQPKENRKSKNRLKSQQGGTRQWLWPPVKKLISGSTSAQGESPTRQPKPPDIKSGQDQEENSTPDPAKPDPLGNPAIINLIRQTCVKLALQEIKKINDVTRHDDKRPLIEINSSPAMTDKWLYDTGASITCMSTSKFRSIPINKRPTKINSPIRAAKAASGDTLIPDGVYLLPMEWNGKKILQQVSVFFGYSRIPAVQG